MDSHGLSWLELSWYLRFGHFLIIWSLLYFMFLCAAFLSFTFKLFEVSLYLGFWHFLAIQIFTYSPKKSADFALVLRFSQGVASIGLVAAVCLVVAFTELSITDLFASILAFIPTGWGILSVSFDWFLYEFFLNIYDLIDDASVRMESIWRLCLTTVNVDEK